MKTIGLGPWCAGLLLLIAGTAVHAQDVCDGVSPVSNTDLKDVAVVTGLSDPVVVTAPPGDFDRIFIVEQGGVIRIKRRGDPPATTSTFLDISAKVVTLGREQGLLGLTFDPDYDQSGHFYVNYTELTQPSPTVFSTVVARYSVSLADPDVADPTETVVMRFRQPQVNHNGGQLAFGPDGFLHVFTGDGGGADDSHGVCGYGQSMVKLLGKILRIDVRGVDPDGTSPDTTCDTAFFDGADYTVPSDNPFADGAGGDCDEIWALGLRNPWRNSFDAANGDLYVGDVGQVCWEEINYVPASQAGGENYGWRIMEGDHCFQVPSSPVNCDPPSDNCSEIGIPDCNDPGLTTPILEYDGTMTACSVIGGYVYRGCRMPDFNGTYFYGDNCVGFVKSFEVQGGMRVNDLDWTTQLGASPFGLTSFGEDARNELYIADASSGEVRKILPPFPDLRVSGPGAAEMFLLNDSGNWTWEDVEFSTMHPVDFYRVYRGVPDGVFECIHSTTDSGWVAGDPTTPGPGGLLAYVVTAVSAGEESSSGDPERTLTNPCPAP